MTQEKFNDAMVRLRQAEENFNKALQDAYSAINKAYLNDSSTELQAQIDEAYNKGLQDLYEACCILARPVPEIRTIFGSSIIDKIILNYSPQEIIYKVLELKNKRNEAQEQELHVGDEIVTDDGIIGIITDVGDDNYVVWVSYRITPAARGLDFCWTNSAKCKKTGRHFDSIPFDYNPEKEEESNK